MNEQRLMRRALDLALRGRGQVEPNPRVGALALQDGEVVGRGWHRFFGGPHAEIEALAEAKEARATPDALLVTLEPCSTPMGEAGKRTPPCTEAILQAGIGEVLVGALDPDPRHHGAGVAALEAAGVRVSRVPDPRTGEINRPFGRWLRLDRPWTLAKYAMTLDGKTACRTGEARWISGAESRRAVHELRARVDAVVVGFRTARIDDPSLTVRHAEGPQPVRVVVDPRAGIDDDSHLVGDAGRHPTWLLVRTDADPLRTGRLRDLGVTVIQVGPRGERGVDLAEAWRELRRRGIRRLMVEGGGSLLAGLFAADCVDQVLAFVAPKIVGGEGAPTPVGGEGLPTMAEAIQLEEIYSFPSGPDLAVGGFVLP